MGFIIPRESSLEAIVDKGLFVVWDDVSPAGSPEPIRCGETVFRVAIKLVIRPILYLTFLAAIPLVQAPCTPATSRFLATHIAKSRHGELAVCLPSYKLGLYISLTTKFR